MTKKPTRFIFQIGDKVTAKNLPVELTDKGFVNDHSYLVRFQWLDDKKQSYYIQAERTNLILQSGDGISTGYAQYFSIKSRNE
jgi:hypothetical protein